MIELKYLYDMELHELRWFKYASADCKVLRVPGGWIYSFKDYGSESRNSIFIPYDEEFKIKVPKE